MKKLVIILSTVISLFANGIIIKESSCSVNQTVENLKKVVTSKGLSVFVVIDHKANAEGVKMKLNESKEIIFGNPLIGTALMQEDITIGLDLPLRVLVYKDSDGKVKMAYRNGSWIASHHKLNAPKKVAKVNKGMDMFTSKAGQCKKD